MSMREIEDHEHDAMVDAIRCRREDSGQEPTQYVPPDRGEKILACYAAGTIRGRGVPSEQVGSVMATLLWLIKHANPTNGRCDPRVNQLCRETFYSKSAVLRALDTLEHHLEWVERERRSGRSTAYHLFFDRMVTDFRHVEEQARNRVVPYATPPSPVRDTTPVSHARPQESIKESVEGKAYPKRAPSPSVMDANEKQKGHPRGSLAGRPECLTNSEMLARQRVDACIAADPFFRANPPSSEAHAAAVNAERLEVGAGRKLISEAANDTWKANRKSA